MAYIDPKIEHLLRRAGFGARPDELDVYRAATFTGAVNLLVNYERIPDDQLEQSVLVKHPEYRDKLCAMPAWMDASAHDIIKYRLKPQPPLRASVVLWSVFAMAAFVM